MPRKRIETGLLVGLLLVTFVAIGACSHRVGSPVKGTQSPEPTPRPKIYDETANGEVQIARAVERAASKSKRVLLMFGANWCGWCYKLHDLFDRDEEIARILFYDYELVLIDIGQWDKHMDIARRHGVELDTTGVPFLIVLDSDGRRVTTQETGALEEGDYHSAAKVKAFLEAWKAAP